MVKEDEVLLDFSMALRLGYRSRYLEGYRDDALPSWDMREADYTSFIKNWIGKTIEVQAYAIDTAPDDSTLMKKTVKIKGFLFPITWDYMEDYLKNEGSILMNKEAVADCMQPNTIISIQKRKRTCGKHCSICGSIQPIPRFSAVPACCSFSLSISKK